MSYTIAIAGKGGTGKTTIAALLISQLAKEKKGKILGIDADPNSNLAESLGLKIKEDIGSIVDSIAKNPQQIPAGMSKDAFIDFRLQTNILESNGFDLLTMGRPEGPGCYCYVNNLLRGLIKKLSDSYDYVVIDNEAGFEHLSRRTMRKADALLVVSDTSQAAIRAAERIKNLIIELDIQAKKKFLVLNRFTKGFDLDKAKKAGLEIAGTLSEDKEILNLNQQGRSVSLLDENTASLQEIKKIISKIL